MHFDGCELTVPGQKREDRNTTLGGENPAGFREAFAAVKGTRLPLQATRNDHTSFPTFDYFKLLLETLNSRSPHQHVNSPKTEDLVRVTKAHDT